MKFLTLPSLFCFKCKCPLLFDVKNHVVIYIHTKEAGCDEAAKKYFIPVHELTKELNIYNDEGRLL